MTAERGHMLVIGIAGASGSGKTTLARALAGRIRGRAVLINQDAYYRDFPDKSFEERRRLNFDEPGIFEHDLLYQDVRALAEGRPILEKGYDFTIHRRRDLDRLIEPGDVLIVEGIHAFYDARLRGLMDLRIFMQVDPDICLLRRALRDIHERARQIDDIAEQYLSTVKPMYEQYVRNYVVYADLIVAGGGQNQLIVEMLSHFVQPGTASLRSAGFRADPGRGGYDGAEGRA